MSAIQETTMYQLMLQKIGEYQPCSVVDIKKSMIKGKLKSKDVTTIIGRMSYEGLIHVFPENKSNGLLKRNSRKYTLIGHPDGVSNEEFDKMVKDESFRLMKKTRGKEEQKVEKGTEWQNPLKLDDSNKKDGVKMFDSLVNDKFDKPIILNYIWTDTKFGNIANKSGVMIGEHKYTVNLIRGHDGNLSGTTVKEEPLICKQ